MVYLDCFDYDIEYSPNGLLDSVTHSAVMTLLDCQKKCQDEEECKHWTHLYDILLSNHINENPSLRICHL